jgi:hypothetical protein
MTNDQLKMTNEGVRQRRTLFFNVPKALVHLTFVIGHLSFCLLSLSSAQTAFDPMSVAIGARPLGFGGAFVAVADDGNTLFNNPAGLGEIDKMKFTSMSGTLLEDVNYTALGAIFPFGDKFSVGAGYAGAFTSGITLRDAHNNVTGTANYGNSVLFLAVGKKLTEKLSLGLTLKSFSADGAGSPSDAGHGLNLDLGLLQSGWNWLKFGLVGQNLLGGSRLNYLNGESETLPLTVKAGIKIALTGSRFDSAIFAPLETTLVADADLFPSAPTPAILRGGIEVVPVPFLALRAGFDQNNLCGGISLKVAGVGFHYAYHPYSDPAGASASYFSLTYDEQDFPREEEVPDVYLAGR